MGKKTIGILGGAGPMAGTLLTKKIFSICQKEYGCINDYDFPKLILLSFPFSEMLRPHTESQQESAVAKQLSESLDFLVSAGANVLSIACNTLHGFLDSKKSWPQLLHLTTVTKYYLESNHVSEVLVLCSSTSAHKEVHDFPAANLPNKDNQQTVDSIIRKILSGNYSAEESRLLESIVRSERELYPHIDGVLLGCTELSLLHDEYPLTLKDVTFIDPIDIVSTQICKQAFIL